jgi:hypothetical protein
VSGVGTFLLLFVITLERTDYFLGSKSFQFVVEYVARAVDEQDGEGLRWAVAGDRPFNFLCPCFPLLASGVIYRIIWN